MDLMKFVGTNGTQHWANPTKISRVTFTESSVIPAVTVFVPGHLELPDGTPAVPDKTIIVEPEKIVPPSLIVHLDTGFAIEVANSASDIADLLTKINAVL